MPEHSMQETISEDLMQDFLQRDYAIAWHARRRAIEDHLANLELQRLKAIQRHKELLQWLETVEERKIAKLHISTVTKGSLESAKANFIEAVKRIFPRWKEEVLHRRKQKIEKLERELAETEERRRQASEGFEREVELHDEVTKRQQALFLAHQKESFEALQRELQRREMLNEDRKADAMLKAATRNAGLQWAKQHSDLVREESQARLEVLKAEVEDKIMPPQPSPSVTVEQAPRQPPSPSYSIAKTPMSAESSSPAKQPRYTPPARDERQTSSTVPTQLSNASKETSSVARSSTTMLNDVRTSQTLTAASPPRHRPPSDSALGASPLRTSLSVTSTTPVPVKEILRASTTEVAPALTPEPPQQTTTATQRPLREAAHSVDRLARLMERQLEEKKKKFPELFEKLQRKQTQSSAPATPIPVEQLTSQRPTPIAVVIDSTATSSKSGRYRVDNDDDREELEHAKRERERNKRKLKELCHSGGKERPKSPSKRMRKQTKPTPATVVSDSDDAPDTAISKRSHNKPEGRTIRESSSKRSPPPPSAVTATPKRSLSTRKRIKERQKTPGKALSSLQSVESGDEVEEVQQDEEIEREVDTKDSSTKGRELELSNMAIEDRARAIRLLARRVEESFKGLSSTERAELYQVPQQQIDADEVQRIFRQAVAPTADWSVVEEFSPRNCVLALLQLAESLVQGLLPGAFVEKMLSTDNPLKDEAELTGLLDSEHAEVWRAVMAHFGRAIDERVVTAEALGQLFAKAILPSDRRTTSTLFEGEDERQLLEDKIARFVTDALKKTTNASRAETTSTGSGPKPTAEPAPPLISDKPRFGPSVATLARSMELESPRPPESSSTNSTSKSSEQLSPLFSVELSPPPTLPLRRPGASKQKLNLGMSAFKRLLSGGAADDLSEGDGVEDTPGFLGFSGSSGGLVLSHSVRRSAAKLKPEELPDDF